MPAKTKSIRREWWRGVIEIIKRERSERQRRKRRKGIEEKKRNALKCGIGGWRKQRISWRQYKTWRRNLNAAASPGNGGGGGSSSLNAKLNVMKMAIRKYRLKMKWPVLSPKAKKALRIEAWRKWKSWLMKAWLKMWKAAWNGEKLSENLSISSCESLRSCLWRNETVESEISGEIQSIMLRKCLSAAIS